MEGQQVGEIKQSRKHLTELFSTLVMTLKKTSVFRESGRLLPVVINVENKMVYSLLHIGRQPIMRQTPEIATPAGKILFAYLQAMYDKTGRVAGAQGADDNTVDLYRLSLSNNATHGHLRQKH